MLGRSTGIAVGYDLSNKYAQISYISSSDDSGKTVSNIPGSEEYNMPLCLFKRSEVNQWFVGRETVGYSTTEEGAIVDRLWERALLGEDVTVAEDTFDPIALLGLYVKRSMAYLYAEVDKKDIKGIMFTVPSLTKRAIEVLEMISTSFVDAGISVGFQGRDESIFYYTIKQPQELWQYDTFVFDYEDGVINTYRFNINKRTKPYVAFVDNVDETNLSAELSYDELDNTFLDIVRNTTDGHIVTCAYLLGEGFSGDWCKESLRELCRNRRAFRGNNLYSRGACYAMQERLQREDGSRNIVFLGKDKLRANVGMNVIRCREQSYLALLNGGDNWFDSRVSKEMILDKGNSVNLVITPLDGRNVKEVTVVLEGLAEREPMATRIRVETIMESQSTLRINVTDLGFGEFYPATNQVFTKQIQLEDNTGL
ncbi:MAG: hypothetical protein KBT19_01570 [Lachnospiraceae bacterium]|nr:hypothetical protein [Candidatus Colinaster equi]